MATTQEKLTLELGAVISREEAMCGLDSRPWTQLNEFEKRLWRLRYQRQQAEEAFRRDCADLQKLQEKEKV